VDSRTRPWTTRGRPVQGRTPGPAKADAFDLLGPQAAKERTHEAPPQPGAPAQPARAPAQPPSSPSPCPDRATANLPPKPGRPRTPGGVGRLMPQPPSRRTSRPTPLGRRELGPLARAGVPRPASVHAGQMQGVGHTSGKYGRLRDQPPRDEGRPARGGPGTRVHGQGLRGVAQPRWIEAQDPTQPDPHLRGTARYPAFKREEPGERGPGASAAPTTTVPPITS
jgi:hypothetical protein